MVQTDVYRYICAEDGQVKYIGISKDIDNRIKQHRQDSWAKGHTWDIEIFKAEKPFNRTTAYILESHFISLYKTYQFYNKAKTTDGILDYEIKGKWIPYKKDIVNNNISLDDEFYKVRQEYIAHKQEDELKQKLKQSNELARLKKEKEMLIQECFDLMKQIIDTKQKRIDTLNSIIDIYRQKEDEKKILKIKDI